MGKSATGVLRDTKFSPERSSTSLASKLVERETLNEPSLEKATFRLQSDVGNVK